MPVDADTVVQMGKEQGQDLSVCVIEKGAELGELRHALAVPPSPHA
jgi:hypothetical protein